MKQHLTVGDVNQMLGVNLWAVRSFRADVQIDFDEYGSVLTATLLNPEPTDSTGGQPH